VIFDLDGTLVQTRRASWDVFRSVSEEFDLGITDPEQYFELFRGNVFASIRRLCRDDEQSEAVKGAFLERLRQDYHPAMIPGMADVVRRLAGRLTLAVMSSNTMPVLRRVLVDNGLAFCFAHVFGGDVAPDKRDAIRLFLADHGSGYGRRCAPDYDEGSSCAVLEHAGTVLVTDTAGDVRDALAEGIRVVGVAWGMHTVDELTSAGAEFVALWPQELAAYLLDDAAGEVTGACAVSRPAPAGGDPAGTPGGAGCCGGCAVPVRRPDGTSLAGAGVLRRERRQRAVEAVRHRSSSPPAPVGPGSGRSSALLDAVRRICPPVEGTRAR
jgi:phosphoglycolate phosphatase